MQRKFEAAIDGAGAHGGRAPIFGAANWRRAAGVGAIALLVAAPGFGDGYIVSLLTFVAIYAVAGFGLQILLGLAGQVSLGQAAFLASGAYSCAFVERLGYGSALGFVAAIIVSTALGLLVALPALRLAGLYLAIATMSFGFIVEEVAERWTSVTGGNSGTIVHPIAIGPYTLGAPWQVYYLSWFACIVVLALCRNLLRTPTGRAMLAVRDSEIAAQSSGIRVALTKGVAFGLSAAFAGLAGALYGHALGFISPDQFTIAMSLDILVMILVGGLGALDGVLYGAVFLVISPELTQRAAALLSPDGSDVPGLRPFLFGVSLILVLMFQPAGLSAIFAHIGRWVGRSVVSGRGS